MNILRSKIGNLVLTAAMIDDFLGWILFSIIMQMMGNQAPKALLAPLQWY